MKVLKTASLHWNQVNAWYKGKKNFPYNQTVFVEVTHLMTHLVTLFIVIPGNVYQ